MIDFAHLHVHTEYSLLDGASRIPVLTERTRELEMWSLAITDHGGMYGAVEFYKACQATGIKPILGCETYVETGSFQPQDGARPTAYHLVLLAENETGYRNLLRLVSIAYLEGFRRKPRVTKELLARHSEGLIALSGCLKGEAAQLFLAGRPHEAMDCLAEYRDIFGAGNFFLELERHGIPQEQLVGRFLVDCSRRLRLPLVATNDVHYVMPEDARAHEILMCIQTLSTMHEGAPVRLETPEFYLKSPEEMATLFADAPEALRNTLAIAERCHVELDLGARHFPDFPVPEGHTVDSYLREQCEEGAQRIYGHLTGEVRARLDYELGVIQQMGFSVYFLIFQDLVNWARAQEIPVGPGRGSAGGSLVSYCLGITRTDPLKYGLLFERFLTPERADFPDIDVDFCQRRRDEVLRYLTQRYGEGHVAHLCAYIRLAARGAIRDVGRALNMSFAEIDDIVRRVPHFGGSSAIAYALEKVPELQNLPRDQEPVKTLLEVSMALENIARHVSIHPSGIVLSKRPLTEVTPLQRAPKGEIITQFDMRSIEDLGLLKMDVLGLRNLTIMDDCLRMARAAGKTDLTVDEIPWDDAATFATLQAGKTLGVFQLESPGMRNLLRRYHPLNLEDLIAILSLYRPGPLQSGMTEAYIERRHGRQKIEYPHPCLEPVLQSTYGVFLYQEQIMLAAQAAAGFSLGQADNLRRAIASGKAERINKWRSDFISGAVRQGLPANEAAEIWAALERVGGYAFNKSHSASYGMISYQTAYLKTHYPAEYMAALLTSEMGYYEMSQYVEEARRAGIRLRPPDINRSEYHFTVEHDCSGREEIRVGLAVIQALGPAALAAIVRERRRGGLYTSLYDFCRRVDLSTVTRPGIENLIRCGCFDFTGHNRAQLLAVLKGTMDQAKRRSCQSCQASFAELGVDETPPDLDPAGINLPAFTAREVMAAERRILGFFVTGHPLSEYADTLREMGVISTAQAELQPEGSIASLAGVVASVRRQRTRKGEYMLFVLLQDLEGLMEIVVFPKLYRAFQDAVQEDQLILVRGRLDRSDEATKLAAHHLEWLSMEAESPSRAVVA